MSTTELLNFGGNLMKINIEILESGCVIINSKIVVASNLSISEIQRLVKEYDELGTSAIVYTPDAMEMKWRQPGFLVSNIERLDIGGTLGYMSETIVKISQDFCILKDANVIQLKDLMKEAV